METRQRNRTSLSLRPDLVLSLKSQAKKNRQTLSSLVEGILLDAICDAPNDETRMAMDSAIRGECEGVLDLSSNVAFLSSMGL